MLGYIGRRLLLMIPTLIGVTIIVLLFIIITPGDPARLLAGSQASEEQVEAVRVQMGLKDPFPVRYANYISGMFHGDFGTSYVTKRPVIGEVLQRMPYTLMLVSISMGLAIIIGIPLGIFAATHQYSWKDNAAIFITLFFVSMPAFWFALMLVQLLCVKLQILPVAGTDTWLGWVLPCVTLALGFAASVARQIRSDLLEVIRQDYITTARAKGQTERKVLYKHALKNAVIPTIMTIGGIFGMTLGGSMITEVIFSIPGLGNYTIKALMSRDYPVIQTSVLFISVLFCIVLLIVDLIFAMVDPRIRAQYSRKKMKEKSEKKVEAPS